MSVVLVTFPAAPVVNEAAKQRDEEVREVVERLTALSMIIIYITCLNI